MNESESMLQILKQLDDSSLDQPAYMIGIETEEEVWAINGHQCRVVVRARRGIIIYQHTNSTDTYETACKLLCAAAQEWLDQREPNWRSMRQRDLHS